MVEKLPPLSEYIARADGPDLIMTYSPDRKYVKFKYTEYTIYDQRWDEITLNSRGHVFRVSDGECVLRPWSKFFNFGELYSETMQHTSLFDLLSKIPGYEPKFDPNGWFSATDKLDGSLCIAGIVDGNLMVTTSGSFTAFQGEWAEKWLRDRGIQYYMASGCTYMFEIICKDDVHPIRYDYEACVLTGVILNATGREYSYENLKMMAKAMGVPLAERIELPSFEATCEYVKKLPASKEGLVLTYGDGFKVKLKGPEFLAAQKLFHSLTPRNLLDIFSWKDGKFPDETVKSIPEELVAIKAFLKSFSEIFDSLGTRIQGFADRCVSNKVDAGRAVYELAREEFDDYPTVIGAAASAGRWALKGPISEEGWMAIRESIYKGMRKVTLENLKMQEFKQENINRDNENDTETK